MTKKLLVSALALEFLVIVLLSIAISSSIKVAKAEKVLNITKDVKHKCEKFFYAINRWFEHFESSLNSEYINSFKNIGHCVAIPASVPKAFGKGTIYIGTHTKEPPLLLKLPTESGTVVDEDSFFFTRTIDENTSLVLAFDKDDLINNLKQSIGCQNISLTIITRKSYVYLTKTHHPQGKLSFYHTLKHVNLVSNNENQFYGLYAVINKEHLAFTQNFGC